MNTRFTTQNIMKTIFQSIVLLAGILWLDLLYFLDGRPSIYEIRDYRQSSDGVDDLYDYQIANIIGWHSTISETQWYLLLIGGVMVIVGMIWLYYKWKKRYYVEPPRPILQECGFQCSFFV